MRLGLIPKRKLTNPEVKKQESENYYTDVIEKKVGRITPTSDAILRSLLDANSIISANITHTPISLTVNEPSIVGRITGGSIASLTMQQVLTMLGVHHSKVCSYISGTGTSGTDNTAMAVKTVVLPAGSLTQVGDRCRIRSYWTGDTGTPVTGTVAINGVTISHTTDGGGATLQLNESLIDYLDNTHANIIEKEAGTLGAASSPNVAGFTWASNQNVTISQDAIGNNHIIVYALIIEVFPKGVA